MATYGRTLPRRRHVQLGLNFGSALLVSLMLAAAALVAAVFVDWAPDTQPGRAFTVGHASGRGLVESTGSYAMPYSAPVYQSTFSTSVTLRGGLTEFAGTEFRPTAARAPEPTRPDGRGFGEGLEGYDVSLVSVTQAPPQVPVTPDAP